MRTVLVTIVGAPAGMRAGGPSGRRDLSLPADVPIAELLGALARLFTGKDDAANPEGWSLARVDGTALDPAASLGANGVLNGALLQLRPASAGPAQVTRLRAEPPEEPPARWGEPAAPAWADPAAPAWVGPAGPVEPGRPLAGQAANPWHGGVAAPVPENPGGAPPGRPSPAMDGQGLDGGEPVVPIGNRYRGSRALTGAAPSGDRLTGAAFEAGGAGEGAGGERASVPRPHGTRTGDPEAGAGGRPRAFTVGGPAPNEPAPNGTPNGSAPNGSALAWSAGGGLAGDQSPDDRFTGAGFTGAEAGFERIESAGTGPGRDGLTGGGAMPDRFAGNGLVSNGLDGNGFNSNGFDGERFTVAGGRHAGVPGGRRGPLPLSGGNGRAAQAAGNGTVPRALPPGAMPPNVNGVAGVAGGVPGAPGVPGVPPAPGRTAGAPAGRRGGTGGAGPLARARRALRSVDYPRHLDAGIVAPLLRRGVTIAVVSPKPGVGRTTVTALLAATLMELRPDQVRVVDGGPAVSGRRGRGDRGAVARLRRRRAASLEQPPGNAAELAYGPLGGRLDEPFDGRLAGPGDRLGGEVVAGMAAAAPGGVTPGSAGLGSAGLGGVALGGVVLVDCAPGLDSSAARAAIGAADQLVLVTDADPATGSLAVEVATPLLEAGRSVTIVVDQRPLRGPRLDVGRLHQMLPLAGGPVVLPYEPAAGAALDERRFDLRDAPAGWRRAGRELAFILTADWRARGYAR